MEGECDCVAAQVSVRVVTVTVTVTPKEIVTPALQAGAVGFA